MGMFELWFKIVSKNYTRQKGWVAFLTFLKSKKVSDIIFVYFGHTKVLGNIFDLVSWNG